MLTALRRAIVPLVLAAALAACANAAPPALADLKLEPLLIQDGDLPTGYTAGQVRSDPPAMFANVPPADNAIYQQFEQGGGPAGGVAVFLFEDATKVQAAYDVIVGGFGDNPPAITGLGDQAASPLPIPLLPGVDLAFRECGAVVHIRTADNDVDAAMAYAARLADRLKPLVCR